MMSDDEKQLLLAVKSGSTPRESAVALEINRKRLLYLCDRWTDKGWYDYGVSADLGWLTKEGKAVQV